MSFFERWFGANSANQPQPDISFGRYSDLYRTDANNQAWERALAHFEAGQYLASYQAFLAYLRDEAEDNVHWEESRQEIRFEFFQGSKRITGHANDHHLRLEARVAKAGGQSRTELLRRLLEHNYALKFGRYALDEDRHICVVFDTHTLDASPYKLYAAFKEVAIQADKQDDLLLEEFRQLEPVDSSHLAFLSEAEQTTKYQFIVACIQRTLAAIDHGALDPQQYPGGIAYLLLDALYRIDYLTKPEGMTMEILERAHRQYFTQARQRPPQAKNEQLRRCLQRLLDRSQSDFQKEMYRGKSTFGITLPVTHERIVLLIDAEEANFNWYQQNGYPEIAQAIVGYVIGYGLFNYAAPEPDRDFFHLYYRITEPAYFAQLGFHHSYRHPLSGKLDRRQIRRAIHEIAKRHQTDYPLLQPDASQLQWENVTEFGLSYLRMIRNLNLAKAKP